MIPKGSALWGPARPVRGDVRAPKRKTATPRIPEAAPAPTDCEQMAKEKLGERVKLYMASMAKSAIMSGQGEAGVTRHT